MKLFSNYSQAVHMCIVYVSVDQLYYSFTIVHNLIVIFDQTNVLSEMI